MSPFPENKPAWILVVDMDREYNLIWWSHFEAGNRHIVIPVTWGKRFF